MKVVIFESEELMRSQSVGVESTNTLGRGFNRDDVSYSRQGGYVTGDEYLGNDISYNKGIFRSAEENSDDATIVNHY